MSNRKIPEDYDMFDKYLKAMTAFLILVLCLTLLGVWKLVEIIVSLFN